LTVPHPCNDQSEARANARLIEASPELLKSLKDCREVLGTLKCHIEHLGDETGSDGDLLESANVALSLAHGAIKKATG
jgi:hypothetical protein